MSNILSYAGAISKIPVKSHKHLLLGNGFSQAWKSDVFSYRSLLENADFDKIDPVVRRCFDSLETSDFEAVIRTMKDSATLLNVYGGSDEITKKLNEHSEALKALLVETITANHPDAPNQISDDQYRAVRTFLRQFKNTYTLSYDMLLYWSLLHSFEDESPAEKIEPDDGFRHPDGEFEPSYVSWEIENTNNQNTYYLHGALHLYETKTELMKFTWSRTGLSLLTQIREALNSNKYPLIVAEGTSDQKMSKIMQSSYLQRGLKSLASISGALIVYGFSFSDNDKHVLKRIAKGKVKQLIVGLYGDPSSEGNKLIMHKCNELKSARSDRNKLEVVYFDSATAQVWGT